MDVDSDASQLGGRPATDRRRRVDAPWRPYVVAGPSGQGSTSIKTAPTPSVHCPLQSLPLPSPSLSCFQETAPCRRHERRAAGLPPLCRQAKLCRQRCCPSASPCPAPCSCRTTPLPRHLAAAIAGRHRGMLPMHVAGPSQANADQAKALCECA